MKGKFTIKGGGYGGIWLVSSQEGWGGGKGGGWRVAKKKVCCCPFTNWVHCRLDCLEEGGAWGNTMSSFRWKKRGKKSGVLAREKVILGTRAALRLPRRGSKTLGKKGVSLCW